MNLELVSLIIPYYKTPKNQMLNCIQSIINQSYKKLDIIIVDDGSGEDYQSILNEINGLDSRIRVIYKEKNTGLSATRNYGLDFALGEYVMFIDSDDMIHPFAIENMMNVLINSNSDMAIGQLTLINEYVINSKNNDISDYEVMDTQTALDRLLRIDGFGSTACGRLAKKNIWNRNGDEPFIEGMLHEDLASMWEIINNCSAVCFLRGEYYYYYQGGESSIHSKVVSEKFCYDYFNGLKKRNDTLTLMYPKLESSIALSYLINIPTIYIYSYETAEPIHMKKFRETLRVAFANNYKMGISSPNCNLKTSIRYSLFLCCPKLYMSIYKFIRKKKGLRI